MSKKKLNFSSCYHKLAIEAMLTLKKELILFSNILEYNKKYELCYVYLTSLYLLNELHVIINYYNFLMFSSKNDS